MFDINAHGPVPWSIERLPRDDRGFPIPWFVATLRDGARDFRIADQRLAATAVQHDKCWICGQKNSPRKSFVIGPMCTVSRTSSEPPAHTYCARWAVKSCPFLAHPKRVRDEENLPEGSVEPGGEMIKRNPGVTALWTVRKFTIWNPGNGILFDIGEPEDVEWWSERQLATREQVEAALLSGEPLLRQRCETDEDHSALGIYLAEARKFLPEAA